MLTPGFLTDFVGLLLLVPPTRALIRPLVMRSMARRAQAAVATSAAGGATGFGGFGGATGFRTVIINTDLIDTDLADTDVAGPGGTGRPDDRPTPSARVIRVEPNDTGGSDAAGGELSAGD